LISLCRHPGAVSARRAVTGPGRDPVHLAAQVRLPHVPWLQRLGRP